MSGHDLTVRSRPDGSYGATCSCGVGMIVFSRENAGAWHDDHVAGRIPGQVPPAVGDRVRAVRFHVSREGQVDSQGLVRDPSGEVLTVDDNVTVPPGTEGTVSHVDGCGTLHVHWDNGRRLGLLPGRDQWEVL